MRLNKTTAIIGPRVILVPYRSEHVKKYHEWMSDEEIRISTASEPLSLEEEFKMCKTWSDDEDKMTFIIIERDLEKFSTELENKLITLKKQSYSSSSSSVKKEEEEELIKKIQFIHRDKSKMIGDINLFLSTNEEEEEQENDPNESSRSSISKVFNNQKAELEIMIASNEHRSRGFAKESLKIFLGFIFLNFRIKDFNYLLKDHYLDLPESENYRIRISDDHLYDQNILINHFFVKISFENSISQNLFRSLGFEVFKSNPIFEEVEYRLKFTSPSSSSDQNLNDKLSSSYSNSSNRYKNNDEKNDEDDRKINRSSIKIYLEDLFKSYQKYLNDNNFDNHSNYNKNFNSDDDDRYFFSKSFKYRFLFDLSDGFEGVKFYVIDWPIYP